MYVASIKDKFLSFTNKSNFVFYSYEVKKPRKPKGYWDKEENLISFLDTLKHAHNLHNGEDWNKITVHEIRKLRGNQLLKKYSINEIKSMGSSEYSNIYKDKPQNKDYGYWNNEENINKFFELLKNKYNLNTKQDWNSLTCKEIRKSGGVSLLNKYSIKQLRLQACPELKDTIKIFKKPKKMNGFWNKHENIIQFLDEFKKEYNLRSIEDWNRISLRQIKSFGGSALINKLSLLQLMKIAFPNSEDKWGRINNSKKDKRSSQRWLFLQVQKLFPGCEIVEDYFHQELTRVSSAPVQFDVFVIDKNVAFEFHGIQHYEDVAYTSPVEMYTKRDKEKEILCKKFKIPLIIVPYWWDNTKESLLGYVQQFNSTN